MSAYEPALKFFNANIGSCGQVFDTIESLKEHEELEKEDKELQNKGL
jgi:hypothetical protein